MTTSYHVGIPQTADPDLTNQDDGSVGVKQTSQSRTTDSQIASDPRVAFHVDADRRCCRSAGEGLELFRMGPLGASNRMARDRRFHISFHGHADLRPATHLCTARLPGPDITRSSSRTNHPHQVNKSLRASGDGRPAPSLWALARCRAVLSDARQHPRHRQRRPSRRVIPELPHH